MNYIQTVILSIIEGITEFLPISSTGHMILVSDILKIAQTEFQKSFEIIIQLGAILSIIFLYRNTFIKSLNIWKKVLVAFIPTGIAGFTLYKIVKLYLLGNTIVVIVSLFIGGLVLIFLEKVHKEKDYHLDDIGKLSYKNAFLIGLFQSVSMIPGVSRAAATIFGGLFLGLKRKTAVEFSFLLAVPTMLAATLLDLYKNHMSFSSSQFFTLAIGFAGAFITAYFTVKYFIQFIKTHTFIPFGIYRIILALLFWFVMLR